MSYNIDTMTVKTLDNLTIPVKALYETEREDWKPSQPQVLNYETMEVQIVGGCGQTINGNIKDGILEVTKLDLSGEGSGSYMHYVINNALKQSTGQLEAVCIWEGGDSITRLTVDNGNLTEENIEL